MLRTETFTIRLVVKNRREIAGYVRDVYLSADDQGYDLIGSAVYSDIIAALGKTVVAVVHQLDHAHCRGTLEGCYLDVNGGELRLFDVLRVLSLCYISLIA